MSETRLEAERQFALKNFIRAKAKFEECLRENLSLREETQVKEHVAKCDRLYNEEISRREPGEAEFPIYHEIEKMASIGRVKISESLPEKHIELDSKNSKECVKTFLDHFVRDSFKEKYQVLDWNLEKLKCYVNSVGESNLRGIINGKSYELACAIALVSHKLSIPVSSDFVFSGTLNKSGSSVKVGSVNHAKEKLDAVEMERPNCRGFYIVDDKLNSPNIQIKRNGDLGSIITEVFDDLTARMDEHLKDCPFDITKLIRLRVIQGVTDRDSEINIFRFDHPNNLLESEYPILFKFLDDISPLVRDSLHGVVIDGLKLAILAPYLMGSQTIRNNIQKFISLRMTQPSNKKEYIKACVIRTPNNNNDDNLFPGRTIYIKEKPI